MPLSDVIKKLKSGHDLHVDEVRSVFDAIFIGSVAAESIGTFLLALHDKGETSDEIRGAVLSMREKALTMSAPENTIDIVGTGGDGRNTLNISTAVAMTVAACGVKVAKHGNRSATSKSGSSDVLTALGINIEPPFPILEECLAEANLCFLFAPRHHPVMRYVVDVRKKLRVQTIFNLLGPLTNPANVKHHLIGVYDNKWLFPMAQVLRDLGSESAWLTHGRDGMDELTICDTSDVVSLYKVSIDKTILEPKDANIPLLTTPESLHGGDASYNAAALTKLFAGEKGAYRDIVLYNAAAALFVSKRASDLITGVTLAAQALDNGAAQAVLNKVVKLTNQAK